jgi:hypothetical protein
MIDKLEKIGRLVLWLALSVFCVATPIAVHQQSTKQESAAAELVAEQGRQRDAKAKKEAEALALLPIKTLGSTMNILNGAKGRIWFTNTSTRRGYVCVAGKATSNAGEAHSLPACTKVEPYSGGMLELLFSGDDIAASCADDCRFTYQDAVAPR